MPASGTDTEVYPFPGCCEHSDRVHSSKACQITGCSCKRRRIIVPPVETIPLEVDLDGEGPDHVAARAYGDAVYEAVVLSMDGQHVRAALRIEFALAAMLEHITEAREEGPREP